MSEEKNEFKPGQMALVAIKEQNKVVSTFKKPLAVPKQKKTKHVILTEEKYLSVSETFKGFSQNSETHRDNCRN